MIPIILHLSKNNPHKLYGKDTRNCQEKVKKINHLKSNQLVPSIYTMKELCFFSLDQWEISTHLLWGKCFNIPHHYDPHLNQTKLNGLLPLTIPGVLDNSFVKWTWQKNIWRWRAVCQWWSLLSRWLYKGGGVKHWASGSSSPLFNTFIGRRAIWHCGQFESMNTILKHGQQRNKTNNLTSSLRTFA